MEKIDLKKMLDYIRNLVYMKYYGKVELTFKRGECVNIKEIKSIELK